MRGDVLDAARWEVLTPEEFGDEALAWDGPGYEQTLAWRNARGAVEIGTAPLKQLVAQANRAPALVEEVRALRDAIGEARERLIRLDSNASWMLHRGKHEWDENAINHAIGDARRMVEEIDALLPTTEGGGEG